MKRLDASLLALVFVVWAALAAMYAAVPMLEMPASARVWGVGALLFLALAILAAWGERSDMHDD